MRLRALGALTLSLAVVGGIAPLTAAQAATVTPHDAGTAATEFYVSTGFYTSVGNGVTVDFTDPDVTIAADLGSITATDGSWQLDLAAPSGGQLAPGTYSGATTYPVASGTAPGLGLTGSSSCGGTSYGSFTIVEITATTLNATFSQSCSSTGAPTSVGFIRYNATTATTVPALPSSAEAISAPPNSGTTSSAASSEFSFLDTAGDWIGQGQSGDYTGSAVTISGNLGDVSASAGGISLTLEAPNGQQLVPGTYVGATRADIGPNSNPGISATAPGRGCNQDFGTFTIYQIAGDPSTGALTELNATFEHSCEVATSDPLIGFIRYNATASTPIPAFLTAAVNPTAGSAAADGETNVTLTATGNATAGAGYSYDFGDDEAAVTSSSSSTTKEEWEGTYPVAVTVTDAGQSVTSAKKYFTVGDGYHAVTPQRLLDTRNGTGGTTGPIAKNGKVILTLPSSITDSGHGTLRAVTLNLTVTQPTALGLVTAYSTGLSQNPTTSNLNYSKGQTIANLVTVPIVSNQIVLAVTSGGTEQLIADLEGYYTSGNDPANAGYGAVTPTRIMDTRHNIGGVGGRVAGGKTIELKLPSSVPTGASAVVLNVTAVAPATAGFVSAFPDGSTPNTSNVNYPAGANLPNLVIVSVPADRTIDFKNGGSGAVDIVADLDGYFSATATAKFVPVFPTRLFDTRKYGGALGPYYYEWYAMAYALQVPAPALTAALYNVTVTQPTAPGFVSVVPDPLTTMPTVSNLNFGTGQTIANSVLAPMTDGLQDFNNGSPTGSIQLISDLFGYFAQPTSSVAPPSAPIGPSARGNAVRAPATRLGTLAGATH